MLVSVIISTYNRSNVLRYSIETVLWQTLEDWELIVVGDACTDDTADIVASFGDPRIRFVNRSENFGEQSAPNNEGMALAQGRYVALLNHDDLWLPDHLALCVDAIGNNGADLVYTEPLLINAACQSFITGATATGRYEPWICLPASAWLFRRELADKVGPWHAARDHFAAPSQEWLYRAFQGGARLIAIPRVTLVAIVSGIRRGSYSERQDDEHRLWMRRLRDEPHFIETNLTAIAIRQAAENTDGRVWRHLARAGKNAFRRLTLMAGFHPHVPRNALLFGRRGGLVEHARATRGLSPLPRPRRGPT